MPAEKIKVRKFLFDKLIDFVALVMALTALIVTLHVAYGGSDLVALYSAGDKANLYFNYNDTILLEFIVQNKGYGSTVYVIKPLIDCELYNCTVEIKYNDEDFDEIIRPDLKQIEPKSSHLVMLIIRNIDERDMSEHLDVQIRDVVTNEHIIKSFAKAPEATKILFEILYE